jgi:hypothetical protein
VPGSRAGTLPPKERRVLLPTHANWAALVDEF